MPFCAEWKCVLAGEAARLQELQADALEERYLDVLQKCRAIMEQEPLKYEEAQQDFSELPLPKGWGGGTPVVIYGMGAAGNRLFDMLRNDARVKVVALCDQGMGGKVQLLVPWIYLLATGVSMLTVFLSLLRPMKIAAKVSEIEAA